MASLKQATYLRDKAPEDSEATIYYIDLRTPVKYEHFLRRLQDDEKVSMVKGKVAKIEEDSATGDPIVTVEDMLGGGKVKKQYDMVVLAAGMEPAAKGMRLPFEIARDEHGFADADSLQAGIYTAGLARRPDDVSASVQDATGAALKSKQSSARTGAAASMAGGN
jgi:quinone-modifying oxidoreductase subunit QmoA